MVLVFDIVMFVVVRVGLVLSSSVVGVVILISVRWKVVEL